MYSFGARIRTNEWYMRRGDSETELVSDIGIPKNLFLALLRGCAMLHNIAQPLNDSNKSES